MPPNPLILAQQRAQAIERLQAQLASHVEEAERLLLQGLLDKLEDLHADPAALVPLLAEYQAAVGVPLAVYYAQTVLLLPALTESYFAELGVAGFNKLRAPLADYLTARLGITAEGLPVPGGYLSTLTGDTTAQRALLNYAFSSQAAGVGLTEYRKGLQAVVLGTGTGKGLMQALYAQAADDLNRADRVLQGLSAERLGLPAAIYAGGLIASSRPFCVVRNGRCFTRAEIALMGTSKDHLGGYTNKAEGLFSGKVEPYNPLEDAGGANCRHGWHFVSSVIALQMRPDLMENAQGQLVPREPA